VIWLLISLAFGPSVSKAIRVSLLIAICSILTSDSVEIPSSTAIDEEMKAKMRRSSMASSNAQPVFSLDSNWSGFTDRFGRQITTTELF
jgi:NAD kinase